MLAGSYCADHLTDGVIHRSDVEWLGGTHADALALVEAGLWDEHPDGWVFHEWCEYQPTREKREAERAQWRERQHRARENRSALNTSRPVPSRPESHRESRRDNRVTYPQGTPTPPALADVLAELDRKAAND